MDARHPTRLSSGYHWVSLVGNEPRYCRRMVIQDMNVLPADLQQREAPRTTKSVVLQYCIELLKGRASFRAVAVFGVSSMKRTFGWEEFAFQE